MYWYDYKLGTELSGDKFYNINDTSCMLLFTEMLLKRDIPAIPERTPCFRASYEAVLITPCPTFRWKVKKLGGSCEGDTHCERLVDKGGIV